MENNIVMKAEHVSKKYCKSLKHSMLYGISDIGRNLCGLSSHPEKLRENEFWAIDDVSFELRKGEALGLIGPNGSGKSTLLKMLNGIFWPDKGKITVKGRVGALIEVGAGFHPLLTGKENIYINGAILGMSEKEIDAKFNDIVEFADIGDFIDAPVKSYSSGMFVRLGFSVAVHSEPDVLLVDEVLAVGDVNFQYQCLRRIADLLDRCAVILVSHDPHMTRYMCQKVLFLDKGRTQFLGSSTEGVNEYINYMMRSRMEKERLTVSPKYTSKLRLKSVEVFNKDYKEATEIFAGETLIVECSFDATQEIHDAIIAVTLKLDGREKSFHCFSSQIDGGKYYNVTEGEHKFRAIIPKASLKEGLYAVKVTISEKREIAEHAESDDNKFIIVKNARPEFGFYDLNVQFEMDKERMPLIMKSKSEF